MIGNSTNQSEVSVLPEPTVKFNLDTLLLDEGILYDVVVFACNNVGCGPPSNIIAVQNERAEPTTTREPSTTSTTHEPSTTQEPSTTREPSTTCEFGGDPGLIMQKAGKTEEL